VRYRGFWDNDYVFCLLFGVLPIAKFLHYDLLYFDVRRENPPNRVFTRVGFISTVESLREGGEVTNEERKFRNWLGPELNPS